MQREIHYEIEIQASPEDVWQVLTDLDKYAEWNPLLHDASGKLQVGEQVDVTFQTASKQGSLQCMVVEAKPDQELCWKYHVIHPGLLKGKHIFTIESIGKEQVRFIDREIFNGLFVPFLAKDIDTNSKAAMEAMDKALKIRVENQFGQHKDL
jgi:hypothetical protein